MTPRATRLMPVVLEGPAGPLEGLLQEREGESPRLVAVVCHPHPLYGGTLHNKVVHRTAATLHELGAAVLRFNFRGVGASAGAHDRGEGEIGDAGAAIEFLRRRHPRAHVWIAGFSFGSWIAARLAAGDSKIERMILVAPPVTTSNFEVLRTCTTPKLILQGTADTVCPPAALEPEFARWAEPKQLIHIEGASHFFDRQLGDLAKAMSQALADPVSEATS
ncbi:MAG TPA: alpha/beta fold hydrolase [Candidatus Udaeobacter sp.]|nr:alpha/beta fold hydrolase [Candidatus Udaeobacter sp.]